MNSIDHFINQFFSFGGPIIYSLLFSIIAVSIIVLIFLKVIFPQRIKFIHEKEALVLKQTRLMALFAELNPDPLLRVNPEGKIIQTNDASRRLFYNVELQRTRITDCIKNLDIDFKLLIENDEQKSSIETINGNIFTVIMKGNSAFDFANIYFHDITKLKDYEFELEDYKNKLKTLAHTLESKFEKEKKYISSELHDDICQKLILLKMKLDHNVPTETPNIFKSDLDELYNRIRDLSHSIRPTDIEQMGLKFAVEVLVQKINESASMKGAFVYYGEEERFGEDLDTSIYRIIQEGLSNILKHSGATEFSVELVNSEECIDIFVNDNGKGIPQEYFSSKDLRNFGIGLFSIKERLDLFHGTIEIDSNPNEGTSIFVKIPKVKNSNEENSLADYRRS